MAYSKEEKAAYKKRWDLANRDRVLTYQKVNWVSGVFSNLKKRDSNSSKIDVNYLHTLRLTDACRICKHVFDWDKLAGRPSLDRIDATHGYEPGNCWWICNRCNSAKSDASPAELLQVAMQRMYLEALDQIDENNVHPGTIGGQFSLLCKVAGDCQELESLRGTLTLEQKNTCTKLMLKRAKERARERGLPFSLTLEDIQIPEKCPLLGHGFIKGVGAPCSQSPSLDQISAGLGYVPGNVQVISHRANRIKSDTDLLHFLRLTVCMLRVLNGTEIP